MEQRSTGGDGPCLVRKGLLKAAFVVHTGVSVPDTSVLGAALLEQRETML